MKLLLVVLMITAPLLKDQTYQIQVSSCSGETMIVETQGSKYQIKLFNIDILSKEGLKYSCQRVNEASKVEMKIDRYATVVDHITAWIYVDDSILQKELVEHGYARMQIRNPEYGHYEQMMEASIQASANLTDQITKSREFNRKRANRFLLYNIVGISIFCAFALLLHYSKKRRKL